MWAPTDETEPSRGTKEGAGILPNRGDPTGETIAIRLRSKYQPLQQLMEGPRVKLISQCPL